MVERTRGTISILIPVSPSISSHAATSASVERLFSVAGQIVTAKRARLHPDTVTLLVFLHEAIPGGIEREAAAIIQESLSESIIVDD